MIGLAAIFWMFVILFALIGLMRGWARELLVTFSLILSLFVIRVFQSFFGFFPPETEEAGFWVRTLLVLGLVFFGYQTPNLPKLAGTGRFARERLQDSLLGLFLGAINGYLVVGTIWYFLHVAGYPFDIVQAPNPDTPLGQSAIRLISILPPTWMGVPTIYIAVAIAFVFVLVVFL